MKKLRDSSDKRIRALVIPVILSLLLASSCGTNGSSGTAAGASAGAEADTDYMTSVKAVFDSEDEDAGWDASKASAIHLEGSKASAEGGASADGSTVTITSGGTYAVSGELSDGQIIVDANKADVRIVLNSADITCSDSAPIYVKSAGKVILILADGTENHITGGSDYDSSDEEDGPDAAIYSKSDLTVNGSGSLSVEGNYKHGINCKDELKLVGGTITVDAAKDGVRGRDSIAVKDTDLTITAGSDGMQSNNDEDTEKGYIAIVSGTMKITAGNDGIQAETGVLVEGGDITVESGGGSANGESHAENGMGNMGGGKMPGQGFAPGTDGGTVQETIPDSGTADGSAGTVFGDSADTDTISSVTITQTSSGTGTAASDTSSDSTKGIKAGVDITVKGGTVTVDSADDALHSDSSLEITGGSLLLDSGDDGMHSDATMQITGGTVTITKSYEGIESALLTIGGGSLYITSSDDGINVAGGSDETSVAGTSAGNARTQDPMAASANNNLFINGGYIVVDGGGDGIDSNGSITMTDGTVIVNGPTDNANGALDYAGSFKATGGFLVAAGSSGMAQAPDTTSTQNSVMIGASQEAGTIIHIETEDGKDILTFAPSKTYSSVVLCSPDLSEGASFKVYFGGSSDGTEVDGLYQGGTYTPGTESDGFTVSGAVTAVGTAGMMGGGPMGGGADGNGPMGGSPGGNGPAAGGKSGFGR